MRTEWVAKRKKTIKSAPQMLYARQGIVTRRKCSASRRGKSCSGELVRSEVARGPDDYSGHVNHPNLEPMCIGVAPHVQDQFQHRGIRPSLPTSGRNSRTALFGEVRGRHGDDLSTGGDIPAHPQGHPGRFHRAHRDRAHL